jgi:hypothetical protein
VAWLQICKGREIASAASVADGLRATILLSLHADSCINRSGF